MASILDVGRGYRRLAGARKPGGVEPESRAARRGGGDQAAFQIGTLDAVTAIEQHGHRAGKGGSLRGGEIAALQLAQLDRAQRNRFSGTAD